MEFFEITEELKTAPGEYIYHEPTRQIVLCGSFNRSKNQIKVFGQRGLFVDQIQNFKKIKLSKAERKLRHVQSTCKGCGK